MEIGEWAVESLENHLGDQAPETIATSDNRRLAFKAALLARTGADLHARVEPLDAEMEGALALALFGYRDVERLVSAARATASQEICFLVCQKGDCAPLDHHVEALGQDAVRRIVREFGVAVRTLHERLR